MPPPPPLRHHNNSASGGNVGAHNLKRRTSSVHEQDSKNALLSMVPSNEFVEAANSRPFSSRGAIMTSDQEKPSALPQHVSRDREDKTGLDSGGSSLSGTIDRSHVTKRERDLIHEELTKPIGHGNKRSHIATLLSGQHGIANMPPSHSSNNMDTTQIHQSGNKNTDSKLSISSGGGNYVSLLGSNHNGNVTAPNNYGSGIIGNHGSAPLGNYGNAMVGSNHGSIGSYAPLGNHGNKEYQRMREELMLLRVQNKELANDKQRVQREVEELSRLREEDQHEMSELRKQHDLSVDSGSSEAINMFGTEYDSLKQEPVVRKPASDAAVGRLQDSNSKLMKDNLKLGKENNMLNASLSKLKQHVTSTIQMSQKQLDSVKIERDKYKDDLEKIRERLVRAIGDQDKSGKEMRRIVSENQAVLHEYELVMSERNQVYKEMDQLEEKLTKCQKDYEKASKENKSMSEELETLRREIKSALQDRDHAMKELGELKERHASTIEEVKHEVKQETERRMERERSSRDGSDASSKDIATAREIDSLRREVERLKAELVDTQNEVVLAKNRRDWVFSERDKIVRERESIRTLCDKLRRERDSAVSQFMSAVKDSDELKQSKAEAVRQLKEFKEKYESLLEKESNSDVPDTESYHRSTDSAIDSDMSEYHAETIHIDLGSSEDLGFELGAGREENGVIIRHVTPGTPAYSKLRVNDTVLKVNNMDVNVTNSDAVLSQARRAGAQAVAVTVRRKRLLGIHGVKGIVLNLTEDSEPGLKIEGGLYISNITPGSPAAKEGTLAVGDRIVAINGSSVENLGPCDVMKRMRESRSLVSLHVMKFTISHSFSSSSKSIKSSSSLSSAHMAYDYASSGDNTAAVTAQVMTTSLSGVELFSSKSPNVSQRSNGSQTDSLDSPPPVSPRVPQQQILHPHHQRKEDKTSVFTRAFHAIPRLFQPDRNERDTRVKSMYADSILDGAHLDAALSATYSGDSSSRQRTVDNQHRVAEMVLRGNHPQETDIVKYSTNTHPDNDAGAGAGGTLRASGGAKEMTSGGTWPRRHQVLDYVSPFVPPAPKRRTRPTFDDNTYRAPDASSQSTDNTNSTTSHVGGARMAPPEPPVRKDSFHNERIIKHSPQNSDSTLKAFPMHSSSSSPNKSYPTAPPGDKDSGLGKHSERTGSTVSEEIAHVHGSYQAFEARNARIGGSGSLVSRSSVDSIRQAPPPPVIPHGVISSLSPPKLMTSAASVDNAATLQQDFTVVSGHAPMLRPQPLRPTPVGPPYKGKKDRVSAGYRTYSAKPGSLDLTPVYPTPQRRALQAAPQQPSPQQPSHAQKHPASPGATTGASGASSGPAVQSPINMSQAAMFARKDGPAQYVPAEFRTGPGSVRGLQATSPIDLPGARPATSPHYVHTSQRHAHLTQPRGASQYMMTSPPSGSNGGSATLPPPPPPPSGIPPPSSAPPPPPPGYNHRHASLDGVDNWVAMTSGHLRSHPQGYPPPNQGHHHHHQGHRQNLGRNSTPSPSLSHNSTIPSESDFPSMRSHNDPAVSRQYYNRRVRLPPNSKLSSSSLSDGPSPSPISPYHLDQQMAPYAIHQRPIARPVEMEMREIHIEKRSEEIGIKIEKGQGGGIFMSSITENSLAEKAGLFVGDQILEICGINMRNAMYDQVAAVLRQVTGSITLKVQYNPSKYHEENSSSSESAEESSTAAPILHIRSNSPLEMIHPRSGSQRSSNRSQRSQRSSSLNSPEQESRSSSQRSSIIQPEQEPVLPVRSGSGRSNSQSQRSGSGRSSGRSTHGQGYRGNEKCEGDNQGYNPPMRREHSGRSKKEEERLICIQKRQSEECCGVELLGGNSTGHFVHRLAPAGLASNSGALQIGDQILDLNGVSMRILTAEQADQELKKPCESLAIRAQYNAHKYNKAASLHNCDSLYVRCLWDYTAEKEGELSFKRNDILYVDNTMHDSLPGLWRAWLLDENGTKLQCGTVLGKNKLEDEFVLRRSTSDAGDDDGLKGSRRGSANNRRSFFRRKPKHQRNNSKDSRELSSFSDVSLNSDILPILEDGTLMTYERVERADNSVCRPVLVLGPLAEPLINKITSESPDKYQRCLPEVTVGIQLDMNDTTYIDVKANDGRFECIRTATVHEVMASKRHCMLHVHPDAIEKLHRVNIFPIVIFIKHDSAKQIREVKDSRFLPDKMSNKLAKELFQQFSDYEKKYKNSFSDFVSGGSLALMCYRTKQSIDSEQNKTLWVPSGSL